MSNPNYFRNEKIIKMAGGNYQMLREDELRDRCREVEEPFQACLQCLKLYPLDELDKNGGICEKCTKGELNES